MSIRAVILGLALGLAIAAGVYFNDAIIKQTFLVGNHLPVAIFGTAVVFLLAINPLLHAIHARLALRGSEVAVACAIALAACGWPGSAFYRTFTTNVATPAYWLQDKGNWKSNALMSYIPGGSAAIAPGHIRDPRAVLAILLPPADAQPPADPLAVALWQTMTPESQRAVRDLTAVERPGDRERAALATLLNTALVTPLVGPGSPPQPYQLAVELERLPERAQSWVAEASRQRDRIAELQAQRDRLLNAQRQAADAPATPTTQAPPPAAAARRLDLIDTQDRLGHARFLWERATQRANRAVLVDLTQGQILPPPEGDGVLLAGGGNDPSTIGTLIQGRPRGAELPLWELPWPTWWPVLRTYIGLSLLLGLASLCLAMIVHPQWSRRELLPYPVARLIAELTQRDDRREGDTGAATHLKSEISHPTSETSDSRSAAVVSPHGVMPAQPLPPPALLTDSPRGSAYLPAIAHNRLFWYGFLALLALHLWNGLSAWFTWLPAIPLELPFTPLRTLFPNLSKAPYNRGVFEPVIFMSVVAFAFYLGTSVSFSLGISTPLYVLLGGFLIANGVEFGADVVEAKKGNMLRFGSYLAFGLVMLYTGRRYYANVLTASLGGKRGVETPAYAVWSLRALALCIVGSVLLLRMAGLDWLLSTAFVLLVLLTVVVMSRIVAETGAFFLQVYWAPVGVLTALFGFDAIGPTAYLILGVASITLIGDPREQLMPYLTNALQIADRSGDAPPRRIGPWLAVMLVAGLFVAGGATLWFQHNRGVNHADSWAVRWLPQKPFDIAARETGSLASVNELSGAIDLSSLDRLTRIDPVSDAVPWLIAGAVLLLIAAAGRLRIPGWPIHPVLFLVWGTWAIERFAFSFFLGWLIKLAVMKFSGAKGYHTVRPLMVGIIAGELTAVLLWIAVGTLYYFITGQPPAAYTIFPV